MRNQEKLQGCNNKLIGLMDIIDSECKQKDYEVIITSGKRSPEANAVAGGAPKSDHLDGNAVDFMFSDKPIIFAHVTRLWELVEKGAGLWGYVTKMEIVRDIVNRGTPQARWTNHCHLTVMPEPRTAPPIFFTGVYA